MPARDNPPLHAVLTTHDGVVLRFSCVPFAAGSDELLPLARYELDRHVRMLRGVIGSRIVLEGEAPAATSDLGTRRCDAIRRYLDGRGLDASCLATRAA